MKIFLNKTKKIFLNNILFILFFQKNRGKFGENLTKKAKNYFSLNRLIAIYSSLYEIITGAKIIDNEVNFMADVS